jgi:hypothetical protein
MVNRRLWLAVLASTLIACGGDDDGGESAAIDADVFADAPPPPPCSDYAALDLGALDPLPGAEAYRRPQGADPEVELFTLFGEAAGGEKPDMLIVELYDGFGAFEGGDVTTGVFPLTGEETVTESCGVCVYLYADASLVDGTPVDREKDYIATAGTVTIDSIAGNLTGSIADLELTEIDPNSIEGAPLEGGCTSGSASVTFDALIQEEE